MSKKNKKEIRIGKRIFVSEYGERKFKEMCDYARSDNWESRMYALRELTKVDNPVVDLIITEMAMHDEATHIREEAVIIAQRLNIKTRAGQPIRLTKMRPLKHMYEMKDIERKFKHTYSTLDKPTLKEFIIQFRIMYPKAYDLIYGRIISYDKLKKWFEGQCRFHGITFDDIEKNESEEG
ncbi:MAG: hypothetical protein VB115_14385 [Christensenellaceae bacterium]|nr:hypothetical protein [Christensenellaceae bacterium]